MPFVLALLAFAAASYLAVAVVPSWLAALRARGARRRIACALAPERRYRALQDELARSDSVANRARLAAACCELALFEEARRHYLDILARPHGVAPSFMLAKAKTEFALGRFQDAVASLDDLKSLWPYFESDEGHLIYARALEACGRAHEALTEYDALARYHAGAEPRVRHALLLRKLGRREEAEARLVTLIAEFRRAPRFVRRSEAEWLGLAAAARR